MELTKAGEDLYKEIAPAIEKIVEVNDKYSKHCEIILGTYSTMLSKVLSGAIAEFYNENPNAKILAITDNSKMLNNPLSSGEIDIAVIKKCEESEYDSNKYNYISLGNIEYVLIANKKSSLCNKKKIKISDLEDKIVYIPRGNSTSAKTFKKMIESSLCNIEIKRIDSVSMVQIIQEYDNCVGEANTKYLKKEIDNNLVSVLDSEFKIPPTEIGIYYRKDNSSTELKKLIRIIKNKFNHN